jgi:hypothetical protein
MTRIQKELSLKYQSISVPSSIEHKLVEDQSDIENTQAAMNYIISLIKEWELPILQKRLLEKWSGYIYDDDPDDPFIPGAEIYLLESWLTSSFNSAGTDHSPLWSVPVFLFFQIWVYKVNDQNGEGRRNGWGHPALPAPRA